MRSVTSSRVGHWFGLNALAIRYGAQKLGYIRDFDKMLGKPLPDSKALTLMIPAVRIPVFSNLADEREALELWPVYQGRPEVVFFAIFKG